MTNVNGMDPEESRKLNEKEVEEVSGGKLRRELKVRRPRGNRRQDDADNLIKLENGSAND